MSNDQPDIPPTSAAVPSPFTLFPYRGMVIPAQTDAGAEVAMLVFIGEVRGESVPTMPGTYQIALHPSSVAAVIRDLAIYALVKGLPRMDAEIADGPTFGGMTTLD